MNTPLPFPAQPGRVGRVSYDTGRQRQRVGVVLDLADPATAWALALGYQRKYPERPLRLDVLASASATWRTPTLASYERRDYLNSGLAGASADTPTAAPAQLPAMSPAYPPVVVHQQQVPTMTEPPTTVDGYGQFLFRQQGQLLQESRLKVMGLEQQIQTVQQEKVALKEKLDEVNMDLRLKDREHELALKDARRDIRDEFESGEEKPSGLGGFMQAVADPSSPLAGILGVLATKLLGDGSAPAAPVQVAGPAGEMGQVVAGITELLPDVETASKVYAALARILPHPGGLDQLLQLAGIA